jgi:PmbA protein
MTVDEARRYVLRAARARGIGAEVLAQRSRELTVRTHGGAVEHLTQATQRGLGVRVVVCGRVGYAYSEELASQALDWMLDEAVENASLQRSTDGFLPEGAPLGDYTLGSDVSNVALEAKVQAARGVEATIREDNRTKQVMYAYYGERDSDVMLSSTNGADGTYRRGIVGLGGVFVMGDGSSLKQGGDVDWATSIRDLDPGRTALTLTERTGRLLGARTLETGRYTAYFEPKAFARLLAAFWPMWSGVAITEGKSRLAGRLGETIASSLVTIVDDPTLPNGLRSRPFDAEGTPARAITLVDNGVLSAYLTSTAIARTLNVLPSGHAARSYRGFMDVSPSNLFLAPGSGAQPRDGVLVTDLAGLHAGTDTITGEFSVQALGLRMESGAASYPVENFAVAGDFLTLLGNVTSVGDRIEWSLGAGGAVAAPLVEVQDLSFAGA